MGVNPTGVDRNGCVRGCREHPMVIARPKGYAAAMNSSFRRLTALLLTAAVLALVSTGCQTTKGFGKDVEKLGDNIQKKSK